MTLLPIIEVENLFKKIRVTKNKPGPAGAFKALFWPRWGMKVVTDGISFSVEPGEIVGYIGVNGAGKSITVRQIYNGALSEGMDL